MRMDWAELGGKGTNYNVQGWLDSQCGSGTTCSFFQVTDRAQHFQQLMVVSNQRESLLWEVVT